MKQIANELDAFNDLTNHLTISIKYSDDQQIVKGYITEKGNGLIPNNVKNVTIPDVIYNSIESRKIAINENYRKELFARKWSEYQTKHEKHSIAVFIESEIIETDEKIERVKSTVKEFDKYDVYKWAKNWMYFLKEQTEQPDIKPINDTRNRTAIYAFYYHILHTVQPKTRFENDPNGKMEAIRMLTQNKGISLKGFQLKYNELEKEPVKRTSPKKTHILQSVIELLKDNPDGLKLANDYLKAAIKNR